MSKSNTRLLVLLITMAVTFWVADSQATAAQYQSTVESLSVPDVVLVNQGGEKVHLKPFLESGKPVIVDFIYSTCTTICPVLSAGFANLQRELGPDGKNVRLVSISIDPENDTPKIMAAYLKRFRAKPGWDFLTGSRKDINAVMAAFDAYFPSKMSHRPLNFLRSGQGKWVRLEGFMESSDFMNECRKVGIQ
jgi:protein SCO1/2